MRVHLRARGALVVLAVLLCAGPANATPANATPAKTTTQTTASVAGQPAPLLRTVLPTWTGATLTMSAQTTHPRVDNHVRATWESTETASKSGDLLTLRQEWAWTSPYTPAIKATGLKDYSAGAQYLVEYRGHCGHWHQARLEEHFYADDSGTHVLGVRVPAMRGKKVPVRVTATYWYTGGKVNLRDTLTIHPTRGAA